MVDTGEHILGVGNQRNPQTYLKGCQTIWKGVMMSHEAACLCTADMAIKRNAFVAMPWWGLVGMAAVWFVDPGELAAIISASTLRSWFDNWDRDTQASVELQIAGFEYSRMFHAGLLQLSLFAEVTDASKTIAKLISLFAENPVESASEGSTLMILAIPTSSTTSFVYRVGGLEAQALKCVHVTGLTFQKAEQVYETFLSPVMKSMTWETKDADGIQCVFNSSEFFVAQHKRRHWLLAQSEVELSDFCEWLPVAHDQDGTGRLDNSAVRNQCLKMIINVKRRK